MVQVLPAVSEVASRLPEMNAEMNAEMIAEMNAEISEIPAEMSACWELRYWEPLSERFVLGASVSTPSLSAGFVPP